MDVPGIKKVTALVALPFLLWAGMESPSAADEIPSYKEKYLKEVYANIVKAIGESVFEAPTVQMVPGEGKVGYYDPRHNTIFIEEKLYDLCTGFGADSLNALSVILGHELAHHFENHGWAGDFGFSYRDLDIGEKIMERSRENRFELETEADFFGGFYGHLAGYHTLDIWPEVIRSVYEAYQIRENPQKYPTREERIAIAERSQQKLKEAIPVFESANWLILMGEYEAASTVYAHILEFFPSREIFNNLGVAYAIAALQLMDDDRVHFIYPFEFDDRTRLDTRAGGDFGFTGDKEMRIELLLQKALEAFKEALSRDKEYFTALVNQAGVYALMGEYDMALALASRAGREAENRGESNTYINANIVTAIASYYLGETERAENILRETGKNSSALAGLNLELLKTGKNREQILAEREPQGNEKLSFRTERIAGMNMLDISRLEPYEYDFSKHISDNRLSLNVSVYYKAIENGGAYRIDWGNKTLLLLEANGDYSDATVRGIKLHDSTDLLRESYGTEQSTYRARNSSYFFYPGTKIVFRAQDGKVRGWTLYAREE